MVLNTGEKEMLTVWKIQHILSIWNCFVSKLYFGFQFADSFSSLNVFQDSLKNIILPILVPHLLKLWEYKIILLLTVTIITIHLGCLDCERLLAVSCSLYACVLFYYQNNQLHILVTQHGNYIGLNFSVSKPIWNNNAKMMVLHFTLLSSRGHTVWKCYDGVCFHCVWMCLNRSCS